MQHPARAPVGPSAWGRSSQGQPEQWGHLQGASRSHPDGPCSPGLGCCSRPPHPCSCGCWDQQDGIAAEGLDTPRLPGSGGTWPHAALRWASEGRGRCRRQGGSDGSPASRAKSRGLAEGQAGHRQGRPAQGSSDTGLDTLALRWRKKGKKEKGRSGEGRSGEGRAGAAA